MAEPIKTSKTARRSRVARPDQGLVIKTIFPPSLALLTFTQLLCLQKNQIPSLITTSVSVFSVIIRTLFVKSGRPLLSAFTPLPFTTLLSIVLCSRHSKLLNYSISLWEIDLYLSLLDVETFICPSSRMEQRPYAHFKKSCTFLLLSYPLFQIKRLHVEVFPSGSLPKLPISRLQTP